MVTERSHNVLFFRRLEYMVILVVATNWLKIFESRFPDDVQALFENKKFELCSHHCVKAHFLETFNLFSQNGSRGMTHLFVRVMIQNITENHDSAFEPWYWP